jgi:ubiquinone/menaquinone biosynthesis C-methylase UbiE
MGLAEWYDRFAAVYDGSVERVYAPYRARIAEAMALRPGGHVLDVACGTGPNLRHLAAQVGPTGRVVGLDLSEGMLGRARRAVADLAQVELRAQDIRALSADALGPQDGVLSTLGVSVIPEWEAVLERMWALLRPGGHLVIFDIHARSWVPQSTVVTFLAGADLHRAPWTFFEARSLPHTVTWLEGSPHVHGGSPFLLVARRPEA